MGKKSEVEMMNLQADYFRKMGEYDFRGLPIQTRAEMLETSYATVKKWDAKIPKALWEKWLEDDKAMLSQMELKVNDALFNQAAGGDVPAIKLWYQKRLGWSEKQITENLNKNEYLAKLSEDELKKELLKSMSKEDLEEALKDKELLERALKDKELKVVEPVVPVEAVNEK